MERVRRIAAHIDDHPQPTSRTSNIDLLVRHERECLRAQVDAANKDVNIQDLFEWPTLGGFVQIPLENVIPK